MKLLISNIYNYDNQSFLYYELKPGLIFAIYHCIHKGLVEFITNGFKLPDSNVLTFDNFKLQYLPELTNEISNIFEILEKYKIKYLDNNKVSIGIISFNSDYYNIKKINISNKVKICHEQDLHYGKGFEVFYKNLLKQFREREKCIVLFYGAPGTGKTYCIRNIISDLSDDKLFVYVPSDVILRIMEPGFISFLTQYIIDNGKKSIVLIVEDVESLLKDRNENGNIGISNLLNMTDGLLNDILGFQVIATFNMEIE